MEPDPLNDYVHDKEMEKRVNRTWASKVYAIGGFIGLLIFGAGVFFASFPGTYIGVTLVIVVVAIAFFIYDRIFNRLRSKCPICKSKMERFNTDMDSVFMYACLICKRKIFISFYNAG